LDGWSDCRHRAFIALSLIADQLPGFAANSDEFFVAIFSRSPAIN
jgi:hypothetical protein